MIDKNSMLYWWPFLEHVDVPMPRTIIVWTGKKIFQEILDGKAFPSYLAKMFQVAAKEIGYPLFIRTDHASGKHDWENSCYVSSAENLLRNIIGVVEFNEIAGFLGLNYNAIIFREYISLNAPFKAFHGNLPIAKERRYFVDNGKVICHHPYWVEDAIEKTIKKPPDWKKLLRKINQENEEEVYILTKYAEKIGEMLRGYWSIDFAQDQGGTWYFIDAALGENSWHPPCSLRR